jgi:mono/diheme cytochrome c family protein
MSRRILALLAGIALLAGCGSPSPDGGPERMPEGMRESASDRAVGRALFEKHCARCHGTDREKRHQGSERFRPSAPDFTETGYRRADPADLFRAIRQGRAIDPAGGGGLGMPAWAPHFNEKQTWQLVAYLLSRSSINKD